MLEAAAGRGLREVLGTLPGLEEQGCHRPLPAFRSSREEMRPVQMKRKVRGREAAAREAKRDATGVALLQMWA